MMDNRTTVGDNGRSRDEILASVRRNLELSRPFDNQRQEHGMTTAGPHHAMEMPAARGRDDLVDNFRANLEFVGGHCSVVADEKAASEVFKNIVASLKSGRIAASDSSIVDTVAAGAGIEIVKNASTEYLFASDVGVTAAQWGIAETGTLVLASGAERHRLASLVPPVHVCLLKAADIRQSLAEVLELTGDAASRTVTFITGASRTSDIELTLAIGVHGPRELYVIVIENCRS